jgi:hypothetical protein
MERSRLFPFSIFAFPWRSWRLGDLGAIPRRHRGYPLTMTARA